MHKKLESAIAHLVSCILNYQDNVWDSKEEKVTTEEAELAASFLIDKFLFNDIGYPGESIDGAEIGLAIEFAQNAIASEMSEVKQVFNSVSVEITKTEDWQLKIGDNTFVPTDLVAAMITELGVKDALFAIATGFCTYEDGIKDEEFDNLPFKASELKSFFEKKLQEKDQCKDKYDRLYDDLIDKLKDPSNGILQGTFTAIGDALDYYRQHLREIDKESDNFKRTKQEEKHFLSLLHNMRTSIETKIASIEKTLIKFES